MARIKKSKAGRLLDMNHADEGPMLPGVREVVEKVRNVPPHGISETEWQMGGLILSDLYGLQATLAKLSRRDRRAIVFWLINQIRVDLGPYLFACEHLEKYPTIE